MERSVEKTAEFVTVTPEMAARWLAENNIDNRRKRGWWSEALAAAIKRGEWITTHQGIAFTRSGRVADGQHRLEAIVSSGIAVEMLVVRGLPDEAFKVIDNGIKRSVADLTGMPKKAAEACRFLALLAHGGTISPQQCETIAAAGVADIHGRLEEYCCTTKQFYSATPMRAAAVVLVMDGRPEAEVFRTYANLINQRFNELPEAGHALIRQVSSGKARAGETRETFARGLKALNPENARLTKIQIGEADVDAATAFARAVIRRAMAATEAV